ncbi:hypothetical protein GCM10009839_46400 [Catenulispora yoronensis]|uniref:Uncharacterized protein n=1 Tax=Catenulispora yoronensis TaxID=450799 RepID=A0ABP5G2S7_9ACTN
MTATAHISALTEALAAEGWFRIEPPIRPRKTRVIYPPDDNYGMPSLTITEHTGMTNPEGTLVLEIETRADDKVNVHLWAPGGGNGDLEPDAAWLLSTHDNPPTATLLTAIRAAALTNPDPVDITLVIKEQRWKRAEPGGRDIANFERGRTECLTHYLSPTWDFKPFTWDAHLGRAAEGWKALATRATPEHVIATLIVRPTA